jgi:hypothetical protein
MNQRYLILFTLAAAIVCLPMTLANAAGRGGSGHKGGFTGGAKGLRSGFGHGGFGAGCGFGGCGFGGCGFGGGFGGYNDICGYAELYRQLYNNLPYFALHPPVYYSCPVPRTYGYSPFAYPPGVMTPEFAGAAGPLEIINPHVDSTEAKPTTSTKSDRSAATSARVEPLVVINPFVAPNQAVAQIDP